MARKGSKSFEVTRQCLLELAGLPTGVTRTDAAKLLGISETTAGGYLASMCGDGSLARVAGVKEKRYCLPDMVTGVGQLMTDDELEASMTFKRILTKAANGQFVPDKRKVNSVFALAAANS